jgi:acyl carrier protein
MRSVVSQALDRFGTIHGVVHAAGTIAEDAFFGIDQLDRQRCERHFAPKVRGLIVLEKVLAGHHLDFWLIISSLSSILGGLGYAAYAAANSFLDAAISARRDASTTRWIAINWDEWEFPEPSASQTWSSHAVSGILPGEGVETFRRILSSPSLCQVIVSVSDLSARLDQWTNIDSLRSTLERGRGGAIHPRPHLRTDYRAPRNARERGIAEVWQRLLGVEQIGIHDDFFAELGGHSLLAAQVVAQLRSRYGVELSLRSFFAAPTIAQLAEALGPIGEVGDRPASRAVNAGEVQ